MVRSPLVNKRVNDMADVRQIISKLVERTKENRVPWGPTFFGQTYHASVGNQLITITQGRNRSNSTVTLSITDSLGRELVKASYDSAHPEVHRELPDLFEGARRTVIGVDRQLDELLEALDEAPPVSSP